MYHDNPENAKRNIPEKYQEDVDAWTKSVESPEFAHGVRVGESIGRYETYLEVLRAEQAGEFHLWLEYQKPKTTDEWEAWHNEHGKDFDKRWNQNKTI